MGPCVPLYSLLELLRGSPCLESVSILCFTPVVNISVPLQDVHLPQLHTLDLHHNELHTILKYLRMPSVRRVFFCGESHPVSGNELNPTFEVPNLFAGLPSFPIFERPIKSLRLKTTGDGKTNADFSIRLTADGGFVLRVTLSWILDAVPLFDDYLKHSMAQLVGKLSLAPQAHVELLLSYLSPSDIPTYQPFLLITDIESLTVQGGFTTDVLSKLTIHAGSKHRLLPRLRILNIVDRFPLPDEDDKRKLLYCLRSRFTAHVPFTIRLMDTEFSYMDQSKLGHIFEREFLE